MKDKQRKSYKGIRVMLYPTKEQKGLFEKNCGCVRKVYNEALAYSIMKYQVLAAKAAEFDAS